MVQINFNAAGVKPNATLEAIPTGHYPVMITNTTEKPTKKNDGAFIEVEMQIQGGEFAGRKVFDRLNIKNNNQTAVDIAYATLSAICHVTGRFQIQDTAQLHGVPFIVVVQKKVREDLPVPVGEVPNYTNEVKGYKDINGNDPGFSGNGGGQASNAPAWAANNGGQQAQPQQQVQQQQPQGYAQQPQQGQPQAQGGAPAWAQGGNAQGQTQQVQQQQPVQQVQQVQQQPVQQTQQAQPQAGNNAPPPWVTGNAAA